MAVGVVGVGVALAGLGLAALPGATLGVLGGAAVSNSFARRPKPPLRPEEVRRDEEGRLESWGQLLRAVQHGVSRLANHPLDSVGRRPAGFLGWLAGMRTSLLSAAVLLNAAMFWPLILSHVLLLHRRCSCRRHTALTICAHRLPPAGPCPRAARRAVAHAAGGVPTRLHSGAA